MFDRSRLPGDAALAERHEEGRMPSTSSTGRRFTITSLAKRPLVLSLNSKESLHLAPGARVSGVAEQEVTNNPDVKKLKSLSLIQCLAQDPIERDREPGDKKPKARDK
jgi:hypothetical protein